MIEASSIAARGGKHTVRISVRDTGIGIKTEDIDRLFLEFSRLDDSYTRKTEGTGLGLALSKRLVNLHGGIIWVESAGLGKGTTFIIDLPPSPPIRSSDHSSPVGWESIPPKPEMPSKGLVLVVEDESSARDMLADVLVAGGYEVIFAADDEQALSQVQRRAPLAIVLDIVLPRRSGWEILEDIKSNPATQNIPVIIVSVIDERSRALSLGASESLLKPVDRGRLLSVIESVIQRQRSPRTVLIVDDEPTIVKYLAVMARDRGWRVLTATSGALAKAAVDREIPDVVIIDQRMPGMSGLEVIAYFKSKPATARIPVLLHTGKPLEPEETRLLDPLIHRVIQKLESEQLLEELERLRVSADTSLVGSRA